MNIRIIVSPYPALLEDMVAKVYEAATPTAEIDSYVFAQPHTTYASHLFNGLDKITHIIRLFTQSGTLLCEYDREPTEDTVTVFNHIQFKIGDGGTYTPAAGTSAYLNPDMAGMTKDDYVAIRAGYGPLIDGIHIANNILGGFALSQVGDLWSGADEITILPKPKVVTNPVNDSVVGKQWGPTNARADMFVDVVAATNYDASHLRKLIRLAGTNAKYTFSSAAVPPIGYVFRITNFGAFAPGSPDPEVHFDNAPLLWGNTTKAVLGMPFGTTAEFVWDGTSWNCSLINILANSGDFSIRFMGTAVIGNIVYENTVAIVIPDQGTNAYTVLGCLRQRTNNAYHVSAFTTKDYTNVGFKVVVDEWATNPQDLVFDYVIIR